MKIGFVSLGCSKNLVDTEMMIKFYEDKGNEIVSNPADAEMIIINTCGFIEAAKQEAIDTILEMADYKIHGICKHLIVTGCLVERYFEELKESRRNLWLKQQQAIALIKDGRFVEALRVLEDG